MKNWYIIFVAFLFFGCFLNSNDDLSKMPKNLFLKSVTFGKIEKENNHGFKRTVYPNQVLLCINNLDSLGSTYLRRGSAIYINQTVTTKNGIVWHYEAYMPFASIDSNTDCFKCCIYDPNDQSAPKENLIDKNIKSYTYSVNLVLCTNCDRTLLFSGEVTEF